jgi:transposase
MPMVLVQEFRKTDDEFAELGSPKELELDDDEFDELQAGGEVVFLTRHLEEHNATPAQIQSVSIDMSPAFINGVDKHLPNARVTFDKFHVVSHASRALDGVRGEQQKTDPALKGMRWSLLKDADKLNLAQLTDLEALISQYTTHRTARAWMYREQLREILDRKQIHVVSRMLRRWCSNVMRSKLEPMKDVARMILRHFDGIVAWAQTRQTNGLLAR